MFTIKEALEIFVNEYDGGWTAEDYKSKEPILVMCVTDHGYERHLMRGKTYNIVMEGRIGNCDPLCSLEDNPKVCCHVRRFIKVPKGEDNANKATTTSN